MLADLRWLGLDWDEGPDKDGEVPLHFVFHEDPSVDMRAHNALGLH